MTNGNLTSGPLTNNTFGTYTYDARNELTSAGGISYGYDPEGNRTSFTNSTTNTTFVVDPKTSQTLMRIKNGTTNYYIYGAGLLYEIDVTATTNTAAYYHCDSRGSTVTLTDPNGNPTDMVEYSPYGTTTYRYGTNDTPFLFNGRYGVQTDPNGLLYMRARYYSPYLSRFLNPDPSGFMGGLNFYLFANGNPISNEDPFGLSVDWGHVLQGSLTTIGGLGSMIGGALISETGAGAVIGVPAMFIGGTSFGLGITTIANGFAGGSSVNTPTGTIPQGVIEIAGAASGNPNLQGLGSLGDTAVSFAVPPSWGGPLSLVNTLLNPPQLYPGYWPFATPNPANNSFPPGAPTLPSSSTPQASSPDGK